MGSLMINSIHYAITTDSKGEKNLKIGQHLPKLWVIRYRVVFMKHGVD